ncbi:uncharacterized protein LOC121415435 [Lytechinus variegatus]|uniref:uncharacterized protein LOC121415435 n=1 Tax=Lytechinus variegatus TaxID=7654 RepID=UPI001BB10A19|nr:uncharacterized protein LOC121415435 [Lytechinus variegatus]
MVKTIPKIIPALSYNDGCRNGRGAFDMVFGNRVCRFPDCDQHPCKNGWCEETITGYVCHCSTGYTGIHCEQDSNLNSNKPLPTTTATTTTTATISTAAAIITTTTSMTPPQIEPSVKIFFSNHTSSIITGDLTDELVLSSFMSFEASGRPSDLEYDYVSGKIYWLIWPGTLYRSDINGTSSEMVLQSNDSKVWNFSIARKMRILFLYFGGSRNITSMSIENGTVDPTTKRDVVTNLIKQPGAMMFDDEQGYLYATLRTSIVRIHIPSSGEVEVVYENSEATGINRIKIDFTRNVRRIFFIDFRRKKTFYKDVDPSDTSSATELTEYIPYPQNMTLNDIGFFNGVIYLTHGIPSAGVSTMRDYDQPNRSYQFQETHHFSPLRLEIAVIED